MVITRKPRTTIPERYSVALDPALSAVSIESTRQTSIGLHHIPLEHRTEDWNSGDDPLSCSTVYVKRVRGKEIIIKNLVNGG